MDKPKDPLKFEFKQAPSKTNSAMVHYAFKCAEKHPDLIPRELIAYFNAYPDACLELLQSGASNGPITPERLTKFYRTLWDCADAFDMEFTIPKGITVLRAIQGNKIQTDGIEHQAPNPPGMDLPD